MEPVEVQEAKGLTPVIRENRFQLQQVIDSSCLKEFNEQGLIPRDKNGVLNILSVGCLIGYEAGPFLTLGKVHYKGIDIKEDGLELARRSNSDLPSESVEFVFEDAREVKEEDQGKYGLVFMRRPPILKHLYPNESVDPTWRKIVYASYEKVSSQGFIMITTYSQLEAQKCIELLKGKRISIITDRQNKALPSYQTEDIEDYWIIIGTKD